MSGTVNLKLPNPLKLAEDLRAFVADGREDVQYFRPSHYVGDSGNEVKDACLYSRGGCSDGSVGCVIGQTLQRGEWEDGVNSPADIDELCDKSGQDASILNLYVEQGINTFNKYEVGAVLFLSAVQRHQDNGKAWGLAIELAQDEEDDEYQDAAYDWEKAAEREAN